MLASCKNCGGCFNERELAMLKPPKHPWGLTRVGERALARNTESGANAPCPKCGHNPLGIASVPSGH